MRLIPINILFMAAMTICMSANLGQAEEGPFGPERKRADRRANSNPLAGWEKVLAARETESLLSERDKKLAVASFMRPYRAGSWSALIQNVRKHLGRRKLEDVEAINSYLESDGDVSLSEMITRSRLQLVRSGVNNIPSPTLVESMLIRQHLAEMLEQKIEDLRSVELMQTPLEDPKDFLAYRDLIWQRHVQSNELNNAAQLVKQGLVLKSKEAKRKRKSDNDESNDPRATNFEDYGDTLNSLRRELDERALEVRVNRVNYAVEALQDASGGTTERFFSAYAIGVDSEGLAKELRKGNSSFERPALTAPGLVEDLEANLKKGVESAGDDLIEKSRLLFAGLHWWRRGRYGMGTEAFGLLKSKAAVRSKNLSHALMMPKNKPIPTDPAQYSNDPVPDYQRRHLFVWAYEDRIFGEANLGTTKKRYSGPENADEMPLVNKHFDGMIGDRFW